MSKHVFKLIIETPKGVAMFFATHINILEGGRVLGVIEQDGQQITYTEVRNFTVDGSEWKFEREPNYHPTKNCDYCRENNLYRHECQNCREV